MNKLEAQKELSHQMLIRHHECTQDMEFRHLNAVHKLRRDQQQKQHNTEWSSQEEYNKRLEGELNKKHILELKMQPKTLKVMKVQSSYGSSGKPGKSWNFVISFQVWKVMDFNCGSWKVIENYVYGEKLLRKHSFRE